jgi:single-strand DNA-binding protein
MSGETVITIVGNLVDDPELRFTPAGVAVAKFRIASTPRVFDKQTNEWKDGESLFLTCSVWRKAGENVAESLARGTRVIVQGRLKQRSYEDKEQVKRTVYEIDVDEVGPTLARATAAVTKNPAGGGQRQAPAGADDPWATSKPATSQSQDGGWGGGQQQPAAQGAGYSDQPPF